MGTVGEGAGEEGVDGFGFVDSEEEMLVSFEDRMEGFVNIPRVEIQPLHRFVIPRVRTRRGVEEQQNGSSLQLQLSITIISTSNPFPQDPQASLTD